MVDVHHVRPHHIIIGEVVTDILAIPTARCDITIYYLHVNVSCTRSQQILNKRKRQFRDFLSAAQIYFVSPRVWRRVCVFSAAQHVSHVHRFDHFQGLKFRLRPLL